MIERTRIEPPILLGIDVGTQSIRVLAFDAHGRHLVTASRATPSESRGESRAEYDPNALFASVEICLAESVAALPRDVAIAGLAVASVGESCVLVDAEGRATAPALVWHDRRTEAEARAIEARIGRDRLFAVTGHRVDPTLGLCKLVWMRENWPEAFARAARVLNIADWIAFCLSGIAATDFTLASRTLALDIHRRCWSEEILDALGFAPSLFAPLTASGTPLAPMRSELSAKLGFLKPPIVAVGGHDHLCGMFAAGAAKPGMLLDSMGTAEAILFATAGPLTDPGVLAQGFIQGLIATHRELAYIGGGINSSGGAIEWFRALTGGPAHDALIAEARMVPPGSRGVVFLPHLVYAPPPDPDVAGRGAFLGLTAGADRATLYRAILEGLAFQVRRMVEAAASLPAIGPPQEVRVIGGNSRNPLFLSIKASALEMPISVLDEAEATSLGAALLGGVGAGVWPDLDAAVAELARRQRIVGPDPVAAPLYKSLYEDVFRDLQTSLKPINKELAVLDQKPAPAA